MTAPKRIQRRRTTGWTMPADAIYVGRPTRFGNPFTVGGLHPDHAGTIPNAAIAVALYGRELLAGRITYWDPGRRQRLHITPHHLQHHLAGHDLACWCPLLDEHGQPVPCHADVLLRLANQETTP